MGTAPGKTFLLKKISRKNVDYDFFFDTYQKNIYFLKKFTSYNFAASMNNLFFFFSESSHL